jgi:hypothetical protein|tara:strand:- start:511 stop:1170 length:660 start_codon:yes stop_codon:yes gene_type:complete
MEIKPIGINPIQIQVDSVYTVPPVVTGISAPVTIDIGLPIVNLPGCVEARDSTSSTLPTDDPKGNITICDSGLPSFNPINFEPEVELETKPAGVPKVPTPKPPEPPKTPEIPKTPPQTTVAEEKEVVEIQPEVSWVEVYLPPVETVSTTASIAVVATTSALLAKPFADLLLRLIKPTVKKVITKLNQKLGKTVKVESLRERRGQQRSRNKAVRILKGRE